MSSENLPHTNNPSPSRSDQFETYSPFGNIYIGSLLQNIVDYAAPEVLAGKPYRGKEQDVWALGILLYTIIYKENPFYSIDEIMDQNLRVPFVMSDDSIDLIRLMLDRDVDRRIGIKDVMEHPWCKGETGLDGAGGTGDDANAVTPANPS